MPCPRNLSTSQKEALGSRKRQLGYAQLILYDPHLEKDTETLGSFDGDPIPEFWVALEFELRRRALSFINKITGGGRL